MKIIRLLGLSAVAVGAAWFIRERRRMGEPGASPRGAAGGGFRDFVTHRFNPVVMRSGLAGGRVSPWAILEHVGRTSGTTYYTPIYGRTMGDYAFLRLPYGTDVHWVRNVQAAGHCRMQLHETIFDLDEPAIIPAHENPMVPPSLRDALDRTGRLYLRLHVLERAPGIFDRHGSHVVAEPTAVRAPGLEMLHTAPEVSREPATV